MENKEISCLVPLSFLMQIATHGKMGTGELPSLMRTWSQRIIRENGYSTELKNAQDEKIIQLKESLTNVLGKDGVKKIYITTANAGELLEGNL